MKRYGLGAVVLMWGCADTGQDRLEVPLFVAGSDISEPIVAVGGVALSIERADLAFGPLYLCAGATAGDLCDTARLEWLDTVVVDATLPEPVRAGDLTGVTGPVRSWMYDLGISSQLTRAQPFVLDAAAALDGASFVVAGQASLAGLRVPFSASIPIQQSEATELGVPVIRKSTSEAFLREESAGEGALLVRFDAAAWLRGLDLRPYVEDTTCSSGGPALVCAGAVEQSCAPDGTRSSTRDCAALGQVCLIARGCAAELTIEPDSEAFRSLRNALLSGSRPTFEWGFSDFFD